MLDSVYDKVMDDRWFDGLVTRQAQWDAFHRWENQRPQSEFSIEERVAWYASAFQLSRRFSAPLTEKDLQNKAQAIRILRERLAHIKC